VTNDKSSQRRLTGALSDNTSLVGGPMHHTQTAHPHHQVSSNCRVGDLQRGVQVAVASLEPTCTSGGCGSWGWGMAGNAKSAMAPGRNTRQWVEPPNWK